MYHYYFSELFHNIHDELILDIFHSDFERSDHWSENLIFVTWAIDEFHELNILEKNLLAKFSIINTSSHCTISKFQLLPYFLVWVVLIGMLPPL